MTTKKLYPQIDQDENIPDSPQLNPTAPTLETDPQIFRLTHIKEYKLNWKRSWTFILDASADTLEL